MQSVSDSTSSFPSGAEPTRTASTKTFKSVRELKSGSTPSVAFSHYDSKYKCCCGSVHVKQGALLISYLGVAICLFDLVSLALSTQSALSLWTSVISVVLQLLCSLLVIVGIKKRIPALLLPNLFLLLAAILCLLIGAILFLYAAIDPTSVAARYIRSVLESEQEEELAHGDRFGDMLQRLVAIFMTILFFLIAVLVVWWLRVCYACYRYLQDSTRTRNETTVKFTKEPVERV